jgi:predicted nucleic acid-binding protein
VIVVTDTSVVLNLAWLHHEHLLPSLFDTVLAPAAVVTEFDRLAKNEPRFQGLHFPAFIVIASPISIPPSLDSDENLDPGEIAALALALERGIRDVLIDEAAGRAAAVAHGLRPSGLLGLLVQAKKLALIPRVLPLLDRLRDGARFRVDDKLRSRIATLANESSKSE